MDRASSMVKLRVRSRQVVTGGGRQRTQFTVYCPFRQRSMDLEQCAECGDFVGTGGDSEETWKQIACNRLVPAGEMPDAAEMLARASLQRTAVSRLMTTHAICVDSELPLEEVPRILASHRIGATPVVDDQFRPLGMVTRTDLLRRDFDLGTEHGEEIAIPRPRRSGSSCGPVFGAMTRPAICVGERDSLLDAAEMMGARQVHRLVVTGRDGRVVGILSSSDVLRWLSRELPHGEGVAAIVEPG